MVNKVILEIVAYHGSECSPFPCDEEKTCGLSKCSPTNKLEPAVEALKEKIFETFEDKVEVTITFLDESVPDYIKRIYEENHPPVPMILINQKLVPIGRISWTQIQPVLEYAIQASL